MFFAATPNIDDDSSNWAGQDVDITSASYAWARIECASNTARVNMASLTFHPTFCQLQETVQLVASTDATPKKGHRNSSRTPLMASVSPEMLVTAAGAISTVLGLTPLQASMQAAEVKAFRRLEFDYPQEPLLAIAGSVGHTAMRAVQRQLETLTKGPTATSTTTSAKAKKSATASSAPPAGQLERRRRNLSPHATRVLMRWLEDHVASPYPSDEQKAELAEEAAITNEQVRNWFNNKRSRKSGSAPKTFMLAKKITD